MSDGKSETTRESTDSTREYHERYLTAVNNPLRRKILRALKEGDATIEDLKCRTGFEEQDLKWHLSILEHGSCVQKAYKQGEMLYKLTQEGRVIDYMG